ncbi:hypothetical protein [Caulobacter endophyticus]|uniref:hypothetical protein n=1 Tax=Caulobacter endophyticus TaxID=2172652 RepID=UPI00241016A2|nr:hypothetical protein [Caulobacter endophyticus]MDG2529896.1 hypothetical protein [Caulobacter endophyticus]
MPVFEQAGRSWTLYFTDDGSRETVMIEVRNTGDMELVMEIAQHEDGGPMTVSQFEQALPLELVEAALADAKVRLRPMAPA